MPMITYSSGLTLKSPTRGTRNYEETLRTDTWQKISEHDHTGAGRGTSIGTAGIASDAVNDLKIRLRNDQFLRARNAANGGDINIIKVNPSDILEIEKSLHSIQLVTLSDGEASPVTTGIILLPTIMVGCSLLYSVYRDATTDVVQTGHLNLSYNGSSWEISNDFVGDAGMVFSMNSNTIYFTSTVLAGHVSTKMYFVNVSLGV